MATPQTIESNDDTCPAQTAFDYGMLTPELADRLKAQADSIRTRIKKVTADIIEIGKDLRRAKDDLKHGQFTTWVESELGFTVRTAESWVNISRLAERKGEIISLLSPTTAGRIAAKSTPPTVVDQVITKAKSGEIPSDDTVKAMIAEAKDANCRSKSVCKKDLTDDVNRWIATVGAEAVQATVELINRAPDLNGLCAEIKRQAARLQAGGWA
jgi:hypothetical protein